MAFTNRYSFHHGEARGHSELAWQIYGERSQRILPNARTFVNVVQHLPDFGRFEMKFFRKLVFANERCLLVRSKK
jgi:hypothetical protein